MKCKKVELKTGKISWECVDDAPRDPATGKRRQITRRGSTKREARARVEKAIRSLMEDGIDEKVSGNTTFETAALNWLEVYSLTGVKRSTIRIREKEIKILLRYIAKTPISQVTHNMYQKILNDLAPDYARTSIQGVNTTAGMIFKHAIKNKLIKDDPSIGVVVPKKQRTVEDIENEKVEEKYLERSELELFLSAVREHGLDLDLERFYMLAFSGMRSGELCALKWPDVNFTDETIRITKTIYNENNNMKDYQITPPKTEGSIRTINIEREILDLLKSHRKRQMKIHNEYRIQLEDFHEGNFVFCRANGYPFMQKNLISRMQRLMNYVDIDKHATPHIFRHTAISMMTEAGIDLATIMEKVGHEDIKTTMKIYTHVTKKMKEDASGKVRNLYENALQHINFN
ncbi:tyrosine-type recombinase/integrase [Halobacillus litoralis]|uniref:Site-specific integrase n=1 Tax=Halobacillus litoralis TaxID=45668 RepID=A0A410MCL8_9BACI|nr:site-specific integrase [Halobacillus litoralis]QAS52423.1 site-specific integrase [Halobacillus litoralis]